MIVETKRDIKDEAVVIPKGTKGLVKGIQWGEKKDGFVVDFSQPSLTFVSKEDVVISVVEKVVEKKTVKTHSNYEKDKKEIKDDQ